MDEELVLAANKITIGVCVMEKKVKCGYEVLSLIYYLLLFSRWILVFHCVVVLLSLATSFVNVLIDWLCFVLQVFSGPMEQILRRLQAFGEFEVSEC